MRSFCECSAKRLFSLVCAPVQCLSRDIHDSAFVVLDAYFPSAVSEGETVAALTSTLSLSPRRDFHETPAATAITAATDSAVVAAPTPDDAVIESLEQGTREAGDSAMGSGAALAALLHGADQAIAAAAGLARPAGTADLGVDAMDVDDGGVEESKGGDDGDRGTSTEDASASADANADTNVDPGVDRMDEDNEAAARNSDGDGARESKSEAAGDGAEGGGEPGDGATGGEGADGGDGAQQGQGGLACPPGMDPDVFAQLPPEMQQEVVREHQGTVGNVVGAL